MLWVVGDGPTVSRVAASCNAQGFHPRYAVVSLATTPTLPTVPGLENAIIPAGTFPSQVSDSTATRDFHTAVSEYGPSLAAGLDGPTSNVWTSGALMVAASRYLTSKPTTAEIFQGLYAILDNNLGGLTVPLTFHKGASPTVGSCAFISGIHDGVYTGPGTAVPWCADRPTNTGQGDLMDLGKLLRQQWDFGLAAIVLVVVGAIAVVLGWIGVSGHAYLANQLPYLISGGIGGLFLLGIGATLWISSDLRDEWQKLDRVERALDAGRAAAPVDAEEPDRDRDRDVVGV